MNGSLLQYKKLFYLIFILIMYLLPIKARIIWVPNNFSLECVSIFEKQDATEKETKMENTQ